MSNEAKNKLWQKDIDIEKRIESFTIGDDPDYDMLLAPFDVLGSIAHGKMLSTIGLLTEDEFAALHKELVAIYHDIAADKFAIAPGVEDVHSQVELLLTERLGEIGQKIHSGRSRNDQVLVDIRLYLRDELRQVVALVDAFSAQLLELAEKYEDVALPGYTHFQVAMPSSFGLWFSAYAESLVDDLMLLEAAYRITNRNPLGSAAGYGSSLPLDREMTTRLLGFDAPVVNSVYAQIGRGKTERVTAVALAGIAATLGKLAMDTCLYLCQNFAFIRFPDALTTGSSIMPHKKNPDVFELIRGRCNKIQAVPNEIIMLSANLPSGYHRDMQLLKGALFPQITSLKECLDIALFMFENIIVNEDILKDEKYSYLFSVDAVNQQVLAGVPFRQAYREVGRQIEAGEFQRPEGLAYTHLGSSGNLGLEIIEAEKKAILSRFPFEQVDKAVKELLR